MKSKVLSLTGAMLIVLSSVCTAQEDAGAEGFKLAVPEIPVVDEALSSAEEALPLSFELGFSLASSYVWRGQNLGTDASFQPYVTISPEFVPGSLSFTYWVDITKNEPDRNTREVDYAVDYSFDVSELVKAMGASEDSLATKMASFSLSTGYIYYDFPPNGGSKSQEVYWGIDLALPLSPSFYVYNDWDRGRGLWYEFGISQDIDMKAFTLCTYANLGYNHKQWGTTSALSVLDFGASIPIDLGNHMTVEPFLSYAKRLKSTYTDDGADLTHDELYGGMNFSIAF